VRVRYGNIIHENMQAHISTEWDTDITILSTQEKKKLPYVLVFIAWYKYQKEGVHENKLPYVPTVLDSGNKMLFMKINRPTIALVCDNGTIGLFIQIFIAPLNYMI
jgi:hypothetical protein